MASFWSNVTAWTSWVWDFRRERGPRVAVSMDEVEILRRLLVLVGAFISGAGGASLFLEDQSPTVWSADAVRMRDDGAWTARLSIKDLWPMSSSLGFNVPDPSVRPSV